MCCAGKPKNYRHDENVLTDPSRVISWVGGGTAKQTDVQRRQQQTYTRQQLKQLYSGWLLCYYIRLCLLLLIILCSAQTLQSVPTIPADLKRQLWQHVMHECVDDTDVLAAGVAGYVMQVLGEYLCTDRCVLFALCCM